MKRARLIKDFLACLKGNDIAIFSGEGLSKEAFQYDREGNFYIQGSYGIASSLALGIAMNTDKRVFLFVDDGDFMLELNATAQIAVSKCKNIFQVLLDNGCYQSAGGQPTIFRELSSPMGVIFNLGFVTYDFTPHFRKKISVSKMSKTIDNLVGPSTIIIKVDKVCKKDIEEISYSKIKLKNRITCFIKNRELGTSLFTPAIILEDFGADISGGRINGL